MNSKSIIICIAGASGSGKTTFAKKLLAALPKNHTTLISQDSYYKDLSHLTTEEKSKQNFDHPESLDFKLLKDQLINLLKGKEVLQPSYDFNTHSRLESRTTLYPTKIIIVEGTLVLSEKSLLDLYDLKLYINLPQDICLERRINRDISERGRTKESVLKQYELTVKPMFEEFILPSKNNADYIIPGQSNDTYINDIVKEIRKKENLLQ